MGTPPNPAAQRRFLLLNSVLVLAVIAAVVTLALVWLVTTPGGARWVLDRAAGMFGPEARLTGVEGSLSSVLRVKTIDITRKDLQVRIEDVEIERAPGSSWFGRAWFRRASAGRIEVRTASTDAAAQIPLSFKPPYPLRVDEARVGELRIGTIAGQPRNDLVIRDLVVKGEGDERSWKIESGSARTDFGTIRLQGTLATEAPFAIDLKGQLSGARGERTYEAEAELRGTLKRIEAKFAGREGELRGTGTAIVEPFEKQPVRNLALAVRDVDMARYGDLPRTKLSIDATLSPQGSAFKGPIRVANPEAGPIDRDRLPIESVNGTVTLTHERGALRVEFSDATFLFSNPAPKATPGGSAVGSARWSDGRFEAQWRVSGVDLARIHTRLQPTKLSGKVNATANRDGQRFELALAEPRYEIQAKATHARSRLEVESVRIKHGAGEVHGKGFVQTKEKNEFRFEGRAERFDPAILFQVPQGDLNFDFVATGNLAQGPAGEVRLEIGQSRFAGLPASGRARLAGDAKRVASADVDVLLGNARLQAKGAFGRPGDALQFSVRAPDLAPVAKAFGLAAAGRVDAEGRIAGTFAAPGLSLKLNGSNVAFSGFSAQGLDARVEIGADPASPADASIEARGLARSTRDATRHLADRAVATLQGTRSSHRASLNAVTREGQLRVVLQGGLAARTSKPQWDGELVAFESTAAPAFALQKPAPLSLAAGRIELRDAAIKGSWGEVHSALARWTPALLELRGSTPGIAVREAARALKLQALPRGRLVVAGDWDLRAAQSVDGTIALRRVSGDLRVGEPPQPLGLEELAARMDIRAGRASALATIRGRSIGAITGALTATLEHAGMGVRFAPAAPIEGRIDALMPSIEWAADWMGPDARAEGRVEAHLTLAGTMADPRWAGTLTGEKLRIREPTTGFEVENARVALRLRDRSLVVEQFIASTPWNPSKEALRSMGGVAIPAAGTLSAEGAIDLGARTGAITIKATSVPVTQVENRFLALSGEAKLAAGAEGVLATGAFTADAGWIGALETALPSVSEDVVVVRSASAPESRRVRERVRMDVRFDLGPNVWYRGRGIETRLAGGLRVTGEMGLGLRGTGSIRTVGGTYDAYGQKLSIEHGSLTFYGSLENPALNVRALRKGLPVEAGVEVLGTVQRPRVRLVSAPEVPDPEKISWLVLGRGPEDVSQGEAATLVTAATAILGRGSPAGGIAKRFGFDEVRIGRSDTMSALGTLPQTTVAGRTGTASAAEVVTVGKRLHKDVYVIYEQGLAEAEGALRIAWQITDKFQLLLRAGYLPGVDAVYRWTFE